MSDASAEAERLTMALRTRGYVVVEVPLALLVGRVSVQRPSMILCDVDAPGALDQVKRLRDVPGGGQVDIVFLGEAGKTLDELRDEVFHEASGFFVRPVDTFGLVRKVEALIGPPTRPGSIPPRAVGPSSRPPSMRASGPESVPIPPAPPPISTSLIAPRSAPGASSPPSAPAPAAPSAPSQPAAPAPSAPPLPSSAPSNPAPAQTSSLPPSRSSSPPRRTSSSPAPEPSLPRPIPLGFGSADAAAAAPGRQAAPQPEISPELESILARAEQRVGAVAGSVRAPPSLRLSPEAEVDAVLPHDVLAALDEPLDVEEEGEEPEAGTGTGRGTGSGGMRTGLGTGVGVTGSGFGTASGSLGTSAGTGAITGPGRAFEPGPTHPPPRRAAMEDAEPVSEPPRTPPAIPTRPPEPASWPAAGGAMTSIESKPVSSRFDGPPTAFRTTPLPPAPTPESVRLGPPPSSLEPPTPEPPRAAAATTRGTPATPEIPAVLGKGDAPTAVARAVRSRFTGALAFENEQGIRRVVLRDGDFVTSASSVSSETLVAFLTERGTLAPDVIRTLGHKLPPFGRHAGAALIAHGHLRQDELWPVLRSHAEWIVGRVLSMQSGGASVEREVPTRLQAEPAVFGGATGAEVFVEIVRRVVPPGEAIARLGGPKTRFQDGPNAPLLSECALAEREVPLVNRVKTTTLEETLKSTSSTELAAIIYALVELGVIEPVGATALPISSGPEPLIRFDVLDEQAVRERIVARRALVDEGDYFALLGLARSATSYDVQRAYHELRHEFEPSRILTATTADLRDEVDVIIEVLTEAYEILSDQLRRERYRRALEATPR